MLWLKRGIVFSIAMWIISLVLAAIVGAAFLVGIASLAATGFAGLTIMVIIGLVLGWLIQGWLLGEVYERIRK